MDTNFREFSLMDYHARFYSPYLNRWTQPDSIIPDLTNPQSLNRYSYVLNNPVKYSDPSGHRYCDLDGLNCDDHGDDGLFGSDIDWMPGTPYYGGGSDQIKKDVQQDKGIPHTFISDALNVAGELLDASEWLLKSSGGDFNVPSWTSFGLEFQASFHALQAEGETVPYSIVVGSVNAAEQLALDYAAISAGVAGCAGGMAVDGPTFIVGDIMECAFVGGVAYGGIKFFGQKIVIDILNDYAVYPTIDWVFDLFEEEPESGDSQ